MQTRLRVERYRENKIMKPADHIVRKPFGNLTNIQMLGIIDCFVILFNSLKHYYGIIFGLFNVS
jgi:hypothetical protein